VTKRFTLYGSPHSLPTYKVALMLHLAGEPFSFRYVSFQKGMHKTPEFLALSRWGQVPVLIDSGRVYLQSAAIVEHLAETLGQFQGADPVTRQAATGTSMSCFLRSGTATAFNSVSEGFCRSMSSRRLPSTITAVPRRRCQCWIPNLLIATIFAPPNQPSRIYSVAAM
jgi:glutathione S-transferase